MYEAQLVNKIVLSQMAIHFLGKGSELTNKSGMGARGLSEISLVKDYVVYLILTFYVYI